jgi:hypothetical protein
VAANAPDNRFARFEALLEFNLVDVAHLQIRQLFIQLWAMLMSLDRGRGKFLNELYRYDIAEFCRRISELDPTADEMEVRERATVLASMIEGLLVVLGAHGNAAERKRLMSFAKLTGVSIATGRRVKPRSDAAGSARA